MTHEDPLLPEHVVEGVTYEDPCSLNTLLKVWAMRTPRPGYFLNTMLKVWPMRTPCSLNTLLKVWPMRTPLLPEHVVEGVTYEDPLLPEHVVEGVTHEDPQARLLPEHVVEGMTHEDPPAPWTRWLKYCVSFVTKTNNDVSPFYIRFHHQNQCLNALRDLNINSQIRRPFMYKHDYAVSAFSHHNHWYF